MGASEWSRDRPRQRHPHQRLRRRCAQALHSQCRHWDTLGVEGDRQENTEHHGGPERALCLFSLERIEALQAEGHPIVPGAAGENITIAGLDWEEVGPGKRLRLGEAVLIEITRYTEPCFKIRPSFADHDSNRINQKTHPRWSRAYARVIEGGPLLPGDTVELLPES